MKKLLALFFTALFLIAFPQISNAASLEDIKTIIEENYVGEIDGNLQEAQTIDEAIDMLDPYSDFFTKEEFDQFLNSIEMSSVGIGVIIEKHEQGILIKEVIDTGSAASSGIIAGDIITEINGQSAAPLSTQEASSIILGEENTSVTLKVLKANGTTKTYTIVRKPFSIPNATSELLYGKVGYISLSSFSEDGALLVANEYKQLKNEGATSFILDLQNNGGGYVSTAQELIGMFPNAKNAFKLQTVEGTEIVPASPQNILFPTNTKLLVNRNSASASEMTAAALLDQNAAILFGENTYGKGTMQTFFSFEDGSYLKLTVGIFSGPNGTAVNKVGVMPTNETTSDPLYSAHFDSIAENLTNYKKLTSLTNVPTTKTFKVNFNKNLQASIPASAVKLVALGTNSTVDVTLNVIGSQLIVKPTEPLLKSAEYMLIIDPSINDSNNKKLKKGVYLHITVSSN